MALSKKTSGLYSRCYFSPALCTHSICDETSAHRSRHVSLLALLIFCASAARAQDRPLQPIVQGDLGGTQVYTLRAGAGDVIFGTFDLRGTAPDGSVSVGLYDANETKVQELVAEYPDKWPIGLIAPKTGSYRIRITASRTGGSYMLSTNKQSPAQRTAGVVVKPSVRFESSRISELVKDVSAGRTSAVDQFWSEVKAHGGPLVETITDDDSNYLVTFLWQEIYETHNVLVDWFGAAPQDYYMSHIPKTNVWYKTLRLRRGSRFSYRLAPNDRPGETHYTSQKDPLNPHIVFYSVVETPGAPDESWFSRMPSARGSITKHNLDSILLKKKREIFVYTPPGYSSSGGPYPLLILFDGTAYLQTLGAANTLDNLINDDRILPTVVCFVSDARGTPPDQMPTYAEAMATELIPWLRSSYAITASPKDVVIGGYSAGGGGAGFIAFRHPEIFGNVLLQSGGTQLLVPLVLNTPKLPIRFYLDQGLYEYGNWPALSPDEQAVDGTFDQDIPPQGANWLLRARLLRTVLQAKGYDISYHETGGGHEFVHWRATLPDALIALLGQQTK